MPEIHIETDRHRYQHARLNQYLDHEPADLVASAQAGVTLKISIKHWREAASGCRLILLTMDARRLAAWSRRVSAVAQNVVMAAPGTL